MLDLLRLFGGFAVGMFRLQAAREAEMAFLRQQLLVLKRSAPARLRLRNADRVIFVWLYRLFPSVLNTVTIIQPDTSCGTEWASDCIGGGSPALGVDGRRYQRRSVV